MKDGYLAIEYAADAINRLATALVAGGGATGLANCELAVTALERGLAAAKVARDDAKKKIRK